MIRSSNYETHDQPLEIGVSKYWRLPGLKLYEDERDCGGTEIRVSLEVLWFYINALVFVTKRETRRWDDSCRQWGFYFMDRINFVWRWGKKYVSFDIPFVSSVFVKHELLSLDRSRVVYLFTHGLQDYDKQEEAKRDNSADFPYRYELLRGGCQDVTATVVVERWTRRRKWTPIKTATDSIWITFSQEVGPQRGSWKGGCTGCGWTLRHGETAIQGLRRMERERRFER